MKRVVITGMGVISPIGNTINDFWKNIVSGKSGANEITKFDTDKFKTQFACEVKDFSPEEYIDRKEIKKYDLFTQYAIAASEQAIEDAKLDFETMTDDEKRILALSGRLEMVGSQLLKSNSMNFILGMVGHILIRT